MTAPAVTVRSAPAGIMLQKGFSTTVAFAADVDVSLWEKSVKPPGYDGGDAIDTTTMHNSAFRTKAARALIEATDATIKCGYDPDVLNQIMSLINVEGAITINFPDGSTHSFYGFLKSFEPDELTEADPPEATATIVETDWDPVAHAEEEPVTTSVAGT